MTQLLPLPLPLPLLLFVALALALALNGLLPAPALASAAPHSLRLDLLRRRPSGHRIDHLRALARSDRLRQQMISGVIAGRRRACEGGNSSFEMPINSGAYVGTGQYFVRFRVGTPAQKFLLVTDTGSELTWMNCRLRPPCRRCPPDPPAGRRVFEAAASKSFHPIQCSSDLCRTVLPFSLTTCPTPASPCAYDYGYSDGSTAQGFYANESVTVALPDGRKTKLRGLVIGCTASFSGTSFKASDGVLGLGYSNISFAARATAVYGGRFSYCLVDHLSPRNATSYLTFGPNPSINHGLAHGTQLVIEPRLEPFYAVGVEGISVAGEVLRIPESVWDVSRGGGAIVDSGTTLTVLAEPAYRAVVAALSARLTGVPRVDVDPFEYCYNWTAAGDAAPPLPEMVVHFNGSARLEPPAKSYVIDVGPGVKCIGLTSTPWPGVSTIGNILQQEYLWEFDIRNRRLRFQRSTCGPY